MGDCVLLMEQQTLSNALGFELVAGQIWGYLEMRKQSTDPWTTRLCLYEGTTLSRWQISQEPGRFKVGRD